MWMEDHYHPLVGIFFFPHKNPVKLDFFLPACVFLIVWEVGLKFNNC